MMYVFFENIIIIITFIYTSVHNIYNSILFIINIIIIAITKF